MLCVANQGSFSCAVDASGDAGAYGDPCEFLNVCDPGLACLNPENLPDCDMQNAGCCTPFCDLGNPSCPDQALNCTAWFEEGQAPNGFENLGICVL